jgi:hypothetical protein
MRNLQEPGRRPQERKLETYGIITRSYRMISIRRGVRARSHASHGDQVVADLTAREAQRDWLRTIRAIDCHPQTLKCPRLPRRCGGSENCTSSPSLWVITVCAIPLLWCIPDYHATSSAGCLFNCDRGWFDGFGGIGRRREQSAQLWPAAEFLNGINEWDG